ncbi:uncharacterized protein BDZ83DRAFT_611962, partial [Colletotrichum acutatum]
MGQGKGTGRTGPSEQAAGPSLCRNRRGKSYISNGTSTRTLLAWYIWTWEMVGG